MKTAIITNLVFFLAFSMPSVAQTRLVPSDDYPTIQSAIDACVDGDTVLVADGTYTGPGNRDIDFKGKAITVKSENGPQNCVIDCEGSEADPHRGFYFHGRENSSSVLDGFTISNGYTPNNGGGIACLNSSPTITNCIFHYNGSHSLSPPSIFGGGMFNDKNSKPTVVGCTFRANSARWGGGMSNTSSSSPTIINCIFSENTAVVGAGIFNSSYCRPIVRNCLFNANVAEDKGGGMWNGLSDALILNCTFTANSAQSAGGLYNVASSPTLINCLLWGNNPSQFVQLADGTATVKYCCIQNWPDTLPSQGNIALNPFLAPDGYHLGIDSPCIDAGDPNFTPEPSETDLDGEPRILRGRVDIGADEFTTPASLTLKINGLRSVLRNSSPQFTRYTATLLDQYGNAMDVTGSVTWSLDPNTSGIIDPNGLLHTGAVNTPQTVTIHARYSKYGLTAEAQISVDISSLIQLEITGPEKIAEHSSAQYVAFAHYDSGDTNEVTNLATWSLKPPESGTISPKGLLATGPIDTDADITVCAAYTDRGASIQGQFTVQVYTLAGVEITGPADVREYSSAQYKATATYVEGITRDVTPWVIWLLPSPQCGSIDKNGLLKTKRIEQYPNITVYAQYTAHRVTVADSYTVNVIPLAELQIIGPDNLRRYSRAQYNLTAQYADGTTRDVTSSALWWVKPETLAQISEDHWLQIGDVEPSQQITVYAQYTMGGLTLQAQTPVQILPPQILHVPADYNNIQQAVDEAYNGDVILLADGLYSGPHNTSIQLYGKSLTIRSENGPQNCIIDGKDGYGGFYSFGPDEYPAKFTLEGLTLTNIDTTMDDEGLIYSPYASTIIKNCIFTHNKGYRNYYDRGERGGRSTASRSWKPSAALIYALESNLQVSNSIFAENYGHVILCKRGALTNCTIVDNQGIGFYAGYTSDITNCIIRGNEYQLDGYPTPHDIPNHDVRYSDIEGSYPGIGNIDANPVFAFSSDYHLMPNSPCLDAGTNDPPGGPLKSDLDQNPRSLDGNSDGAPVVDMGAYEFDPNHPTIAVSDASLCFQQNWPNPDSQTLLIRNCGGKTLNWTIVQDCNWLRATPSQAISTGRTGKVTLCVDTNSLPPGYYTCSLKVVDANASNNAVVIRVELHTGQFLHVPEVYPTIQSAVDAANDYDVVVVADGTYTGPGNRDIDFCGKAITVKSENGPQNCIIDCNGGYAEPHRGLIFRNGEESSSILDGFTIVNGYAYCGGAICCYDSSPTIENCLITANTAYGGPGRQSRFRGHGGGIYCENSSPTIENCLITANKVHGSYKCGGGIYVNGDSKPIIKECTIARNSAGEGGGVCGIRTSTVIITNCAIIGNIATRQAGAASLEGYAQIRNCLIIGNSAQRTAALLCDGVIYNSVVTDNFATISPAIEPVRSGLQIVNSIVRRNWPESTYVDYSHVFITHTDIEGPYPGIGNIDADPCFVSPGCWADVNDPNIIAYPNDPNAVWVDGDYHLLPNSPCINAGDPNYIPAPDITDLDGRPRIIGPAVDMGAYEFNHTPIADPGPEKQAYAWIDGFAQVTLDGSGSYDLDGQLLSYLWSWTIDGDTYQADGVDPIMELPRGRHIVTLVVSDGVDDSEPNTVAITVTEPLETAAWLFPRTLNRQSAGPKRIVARLRLPAGLSEEQMDENEPLILYPAGIESVRQHVVNTSRGSFKLPTLFAFFSKRELMDAVIENGTVEILIVGKLRAGPYFYGTTTITINSQPPKSHRRHTR